MKTEITICDRCGGQQLGEALSIVSLDYEYAITPMLYPQDLCANCEEMLKTWLTNEPYG